MTVYPEHPGGLPAWLDRDWRHEAERYVALFDGNPAMLADGVRMMGDFLAVAVAEVQGLDQARRQGWAAYFAGRSA